jgi:sec-independent protein translocase protein TatB
MFDIGFSELLVIAVVALLVLGPERLPKAARFAGLWVRRARSQWNSVKSEFEREIADDDLRRTLRDTQASLQDAQASLRNAGSHLQREFEATSEEVMRGPPLPPPAGPEPATGAVPEAEPAPVPAADTAAGEEATPGFDSDRDPPLESASADFDPAEEIDDPEAEAPDQAPAEHAPAKADHDDAHRR